MDTERLEKETQSKFDTEAVTQGVTNLILQVLYIARLRFDALHNYYNIFTTYLNTSLLSLLYISDFLTHIVFSCRLITRTFRTDTMNLSTSCPKSE